METDEHQDDATEQMDQMSAEDSPQSSLKAGSSESSKRSSPIPHSTPHKGFRLSPIEFEDFDNESTLRGPEDEFRSSNKNGLNFGGEEEEEFEVNANVSFLNESSKSMTKSPTRNFKSSYAKSLADSYRRASLPVVVSAPKAQFYFKNEEFITLNNSARPFRASGVDKFPSLNSSVKAPTSGSFEPVSLPTILDVVPESQDVLQSMQGYKNLYNLLIKEQEDIFVPYEKLQQLCESEGSSFSLQDWHSLGSLITSDGRKLVKLSDYQERLQNQTSPIWYENGNANINSRKDNTQQVEGLRLERGQLEGRVEQLCETLADRDNTIQRLEEDLLRIRMECQRMIVENRSLRSVQGMSGAVANVESATQVARLEQQVQLLTAQLTRAERSRYTYEAATRQLVDFLHTVNSTLGTSANASPTSSIHSANASPVPSPSVQTDDDDDPPYSPTQTTPNGSEMRARSISHTFGPSRRGSNPIRRAGSVCTLTTQAGPKPRVSRAVSTHCVASESVNPRPSSAVASGSQDKGSPGGRSHTSEYLATRAKELIASLKSLMRSESVLKLNLEPKKAGVASGSSTSRSTKSEGHSAYSATDDHSRTTIWHVPPEFYLDNLPRDDNQNIERDTLVGDTSQEVCSKGARSVMSGSTSTVLKSPTQPVVEVNGTIQPISLTVVGEASTPLDDRRFSSLPNRGRLPRTLNDSDHRLVWV